MLRQGSLEEISDGRRYGLNDMVKADSCGCKGCSKCCETMTDTIILGPFDIFRMSNKTGKNFGELLTGKYVELNMHDGIILPNIGNNGKGCVFLSDDKRCTIHESRPDFCRLFPLGRLYEDGGFSYILQTGQCDKNCSKIKVKKWINTPDYEVNSKYILAWHDIVKNTREMTTGLMMAENKAVGDKATEERLSAVTQNLLTTLLKLFYYLPYEDFYKEFFERAEEYSKIFEKTEREINGI
jgi:Fe-S-cluster containining protein